MATAAIATLRLNEPAVDTGTTVGDLSGILSNFRKSLLRRNGMALVGTVLQRACQNGELTHAVVEIAWRGLARN